MLHMFNASNWNLKIIRRLRLLQTKFYDMLKENYYLSTTSKLQFQMHLYCNGPLFNIKHSLKVLKCNFILTTITTTNIRFC